MIRRSLSPAPSIEYGFGFVLECQRDGLLARGCPNLDLAGLQFKIDCSGSAGAELVGSWDVLWLDPDVQIIQVSPELGAAVMLVSWFPRGRFVRQVSTSAAKRHGESSWCMRCVVDPVYHNRMVRLDTFWRAVLSQERPQRGLGPLRRSIRRI